MLPMSVAFSFPFLSACDLRVISVEFVKRYAYIILGVLCVLALGGLFILGRDGPAGVMDAGRPLAEVIAQSTPDTQPEATYTPPAQANAEPTPTPEPEMIMVHIVGAVHYPGVYEVPRGSRVSHLVEMAGGYTEDADPELINMSAVVHDATQIRFPFIGDEPVEIPTAGQPGQAAGDTQGGQPQTGITADGRININLASFAELQTLPNIGEVRARNIINFREAHGGFSTIYELLEVSQIGDGTFASIRDYVTVD